MSSMTPSSTDSVKHTAGPWFNEELPATGQSVHGSRCVSFIVTPHGHGNVADVCDSAYMPEAEARANARLIAAAPELLQALQLIAHATAPTHDDGGHHEAAYELATAAITKATRGQS